MARIKPGSLAGSVPLWTQMDVRASTRSRRKKKGSIRPEEILAWFNLAQAVAQDKSILGGLINAVSRGNREEAIASERMRSLESTQRVGQEAPGDRPPLPPMRGIGGEIVPPPAAVPAPPTPQELMLMEQLGAESVQPQAAAPADPVTAAQMQAGVTQRAAGQLAAPAERLTFDQQYRQAMAIDREAELAQAAEFAAQRALTYQDLAGMAASAESGEALRAALRMLPQVMKSDPAFAPRSLSELLFGGGGPSSAEATNNLISIFLKRQGREKTPQERMYKMEQARKAHAKAREIKTLTPVKEQKGLSAAARNWSAVQKDRAQQKWIVERTKKLEEERRRQANRRHARGIKHLGGKKEKMLIAFGAYLDEIKSGTPNILLIPKEFIKDGQIMKPGEAHGTVMGVVGTRNTSRINSLMTHHGRGEKKATPITAAQTQRRQDTARNAVNTALEKYNKAQATATSDPGTVKGMQSQEQAQKLLPSAFAAVQRAVRQANRTGLTIELVGEQNSPLSTTESVPLQVKKVTVK